MLELFGAVAAFLLIVGMLLLTVRGLFARETTHALKRVRQQEDALQAKADLLEQRLSQMEQDHRQKLKHAQGEAERVVQEAKQQAMNIRTAAVEEAKHRARQLVMETEQSRRQMVSELKRELGGQAVAWTYTAFQTLLAPAEQDSLHARLFHQLIETCGQLELSPLIPRLASLTRDDPEQGPAGPRRGADGQAECIRVTSAKPLAKAQTSALQACLSTKFNRPITLEAVTDEALIAGGVVDLGDMVVDGSLKQYLTRLAQENNR